MLRVTVIVEELTEVVTEGEVFPWAIHRLMNSEYITGKFLWIVFFGWLMVIELMILAALYVLGFLLAFAFSCVPILNIFLLIDSIVNDEDVFETVLCVIGILIDIAALIVGLVGHFNGWFAH